MSMDDQSVTTLCKRAFGGTSLTLERPRQLSDLLQIAECFAESKKGAVLFLRNSGMSAVERLRIETAGAGKVYFGE